MPHRDCRDWVGHRFGKLFVLQECAVKRYPNETKRQFLVRCDCGYETVCNLGNLKSGNSKACKKCRDKLAGRFPKAVPQIWTIDGDIAWIEIKGTRVLIDAEDVGTCSRHCWRLNGGYAECDAPFRKLHRLILGLGKGDPREVDHRHHNTADNRKSQIRIATPAQNGCNRRPDPTRRSPYKGVSPVRNRFLAQITVEKQRFRLGMFASAVDAAKAYDAAAAKHFGEFAYLNFPAPQ